MEDKQTNWYNLSEEERIKQVYIKYSVDDFWNWWCAGENKVMEVRIKNFDLIKKIGTQYNMPYSQSGIYVWESRMLKYIMKEVRDNTTVWFGVNCRKINWNKHGKKSFGGTDYNIKQIDILFIDIDRIKKDGPATLKDLENCNKLCDLILEELGKAGWNKNYLKLCSGNGVQLFIKFDVAIKLPEVDFISTKHGGYYTINNEFNNLKNVLIDNVGKKIVSFSNHYKNELQVEVDKACFNIGRVAALPYTKNFKYGGFTYRGILEIKNGINEGFSDYILYNKDNKKINVEYEKIFRSKSVKTINKLNKKNLKEHILVRFMMENKLPKGGRNNMLWFSLKCLLRDNRINFNCDEFREIHKIIEHTQNDTFPCNIPNEEQFFNEQTINNYCFNHLISPLYPVYPTKTKKLNMGLDNIKWEEIYIITGGSKVNLIGGDIIKDIENFKTNLKEGEGGRNEENFAEFLKACIKTYGEEVTKYHFNYTMNKLLTYK